MTKFLNEFSSKNLLKDNGVETGEYYLAKNKEEAVEISENIGYPVVLKIVSDDIIHKTEAKGIKLKLNNKSDVESAFDEILLNAAEYKENAKIDGVIVSRMLKSGVEVIIGGLRDKQFGPVIMFGLGGVFVEIFKDVEFRMAPITKEEAIDLIKSIKAFPMLEGFRGQEPADLDKLSELIVKIGDVLVNNETIQEIDLNPAVCYIDDIQILDASIGISD